MAVFVPEFIGKHRVDCKTVLSFVMVAVLRVKTIFGTIMYAIKRMVVEKSRSSVWVPETRACVG